MTAPKMRHYQYKTDRLIPGRRPGLPWLLGPRISIFLDYARTHVRHEKVVSKFQTARSWAVECPQTMRYRLNMIKEHPEKKGHPRRITFWGDRVLARSLFGIIDWMWLHLPNPILGLISTSYRCFTIPRTLFGRAPSHGRNLVTVSMVKTHRNPLARKHRKNGFVLLILTIFDSARLVNPRYLAPQEWGWKSETIVSK